MRVPRRRTPLPTLPRLVLAVSVSTFLAGCSVGPVYSPPAATSVAAWNAPLPHQGSVVALKDWWASWNDPVLKGLIDAAQAANPTLEQSLARIAQARAARRMAGASQWPGVTGSASLNRGNQIDPSGRAATVASTGFDAAWELDLFGAQQRGRDAADARLTARQTDWHQARVSLAAEMAQTYVNLRINEALLTGYERDFASRTETARLTGLKTRAGFEAPANAALAEASAAEASARLAAQRADVEHGIKALTALTVLHESSLRATLAPGHAQIPKPAVAAIAQLPAVLLSQRPDLAAAERELAALTADIGAAEADRYPRLSLTGSIGYSAARVAGVGIDGITWGFGPSISVPLFDAGRRAANVELARARYDESLATYKAIAIRAIREVEEALTQLQAAQSKAPALQASVAGYQAFERAAQSRLSVGAGSVLELEDARRAVLNAQVAALAVERERLSAWIALYRAAGGGWEQTQTSENR